MLKIRIIGSQNYSSKTDKHSLDEMLSLLRIQEWELCNDNVNNNLSLNNIQNKINSADAFIFLPGAQLEDVFYAISIFVGYQTLDPQLQGKPTIIINTDNSWTALYDLLDQLELFGTIKQNYRKFLLHAASIKEALAHLNYFKKSGVPDIGRKRIYNNRSASFDSDLPEKIQNVVCVFCSASIKDIDYINDGYALGRSLAENNYGCVSGAGTIGVMGSVVQGSVESGGWTAGSNVPHIIEIEGLPKGLSTFWLRPDIYARMEVMIDKSDAFVIFPGGAGTVQELLTLLIMKSSNHPVMINKPIIIFNRIDKNLKKQFWESLLILLKNLSKLDLYTVVEKLEEIIPTLKQNLKNSA